MTSYTVPETDPATERHRLWWVVTDTWVLTVRSVMHILKNPDQFLGLTVQPVMFMLLFYYVFGGAIQTGGLGYLEFLVAGILVQSLAFGAQYTSISIATDLKRGITDRFKSLPIARNAAITGHVLADLVRNAIQGIVLLGVSFLLGFRPSATVFEWGLIIGLALLFTFAISWLSAIMGLLAGSIESVQWMGFLVIFPLTFASSAFVPAETMPGALRWFATNQPVTHVIEAMRALMVGAPLHNHGLLAAVWCVAITALCMPVATWLFKRHGRS